MTGVRLVAAAHTPALRRAVFGGDDDLDEGGRNAAAHAGRLPGPWISSPSRAAVHTARLLGATDLDTDPRLADPDYGAWTGRTLDQVDLGDWLTDPHTTPHGGESLAAVTTRAGHWLDDHTRATVTAVAHPAVVRALLSHALDLPADGIWRFDVAPLAVTRLRHRAGRWHLAVT